MATPGDLGIAGFDYTMIRIGPTVYRPGIAGSGPAVLLLHGFPQRAASWDAVAEQFGRQALGLGPTQAP